MGVAEVSASWLTHSKAGTCALEKPVRVDPDVGSLDFWSRLGRDLRDHTHLRTHITMAQ